jgi:septal ring factor EnvC (AmiA/AmiB activator)
VAPAYAARRSARAEAVFRLARLDKEIEHQGEQLERLEDLVSELVQTAESLRREIADTEDAVAQGSREAAREGPVGD